MAVSTFAYCTASEVKQIYSRIDEFDNKTPVYNWKTTDTTNQYQAFNTGQISQLYFDGIEGTAVGDSPNADYEYNYSSSTDSVQVFLTTANPNDVTVEAGYDWATYLTDAIEMASQQLNSMLDHSRFPVPVPKAVIYDDTDNQAGTYEYDYVIRRLTALLTAFNCITAHNPQSEEAVAILAQITNDSDNGLLDRLNAGNITLNFETDRGDSTQGKILEITSTGSMKLVEATCHEGYYGEPYDRVQLICTTLGAYGIAKISALSFGGEKLYGTEVTNITVSGGLQAIGKGLYVRFEGNALAVDDRFDIEVRNRGLKTTSGSAKSVDITRGRRWRNEA